MASIIAPQGSNTSFSLSVTGPVGGGGVTDSITDCRGGLWLVVYSNGLLSGLSGGFLESISSQYGFNPANGFTEVYTPVYAIATYLGDGSMSSFRAPGTPSGGGYESYICSITAVQFRLVIGFSALDAGRTVQADGTWITSCG